MKKFLWTVLSVYLLLLTIAAGIFGAFFVLGLYPCIPLWTRALAFLIFPPACVLGVKAACWAVDKSCRC